MVQTALITTQNQMRQNRLVSILTGQGFVVDCLNLDEIAESLSYDVVICDRGLNPGDVQYPIVWLLDSVDDAFADDDNIIDFYIPAQQEPAFLLAAIRSAIARHTTQIERDWIESRLGQSDSRFRSVITSSADGMLVVDQQGVVQFANPAAIALFNRNSLVGAVFGFPVVSGETSELEIVTQSDVESVVEMQVVETEWEGAPAQLASLRDITERKRLEREIREKELLRIALEKEVTLRKMRNQFMSMVSHEFRTPLSTISTSSDILLSYFNRLDEKRRMQHLMRIKDQVSHLIEMLDDILTIIRAETVGPEFQASMIDVYALCAETVETLRYGLTDIHYLEFVSTCGDVELLGDAKLLKRAIDNLLSNAIKYSPDGGRVRLELSCDEDYIIITISDNGIGIPPRRKATIFDAFYRADNVGLITGTGLGLAIAKQSVELHNGSLAVESTVGEGSVFTLKLPRQSDYI